MISTQSFEEAGKTCSQQENGASLLSIRSQEEQEFLSHFLFETSGVVDSVWLGGKRINNSNVFKWIDGFEFNYTNWKEDSPTNQHGRDCIQMNSPFVFSIQNSTQFVENARVSTKHLSVGQWIDAPCKKKNLVVCQKLQHWSIARLQKTLLDAKKEFQDSLQNVNKQLNNHESTINEQQSTISNQQSMINDLQQNPIPINFTYTQLPNQPYPKSLWPTVEWKDVTSEYSGLFFRAEGNNSAAFGVMQEENAPRLKNVDWWIPGYQYRNHIIPLQKNSWSQPLWVGGRGSSEIVIDFYVSGGEVRPRNMAIRIWKRIW
ncbi:hypothetical protein RDWZM_006023 [Blomia tropicalis]|uniref:C-type lectin domain-containing protein n=1 Tax=Blomia tropicalis TaxID=40697 RepID=A0A9Q0RNZ1_BLOTA|nr:hypothetical protein RDWZM_006023 [Blomia tropicalis]